MEKDSEKKNVETSIIDYLKNAIGMDLTRFSVPVTYNEPTTFLMRMMEVSLNHIYLLNKADKIAAKDPELALLYVAIYSLSVFSSGVQRVKTKPFNPLLGETYEFYDREHEIKFFAEQVSHHPPIGASHIQSEHFEINFYLGVETKFTGNAVTSKPFAGTQIRLKSTGATFVYGGVTSVAHNILIGNRWVDIFGKVTVTELNTTRYCSLNCKECDFFSSNWHAVTGICYSDKKVRSYIFEGTWNDKILAQKVVANKLSTSSPKISKKESKEASKEEKVKLNKSEDSLSASSSKDSLTSKSASNSKSKIVITSEQKELASKDQKHTPRNDQFNTEVPNFDHGKAVLIWKNFVELYSDKPYDHWEMTQLAVKAITFDEKYYFSKDLPATDSRLRADRIAVEKMDFDTAEAEKHKYEVKQRKEKDDRDANNQPWVPIYFENEKLENGIEIYKYKKNFKDFK